MLFEQGTERSRGKPSGKWLLAYLGGSPIDRYRCEMIHRQSSRVWPLAALI
jgi:hypothetical protein